MEKLTKELIAETKDAIKQFGAYEFGDKGPQEVMDIASAVNRLRALGPQEARKVLVELCSYKTKNGDYGLSVASCCVCDMQDWDELFQQPGIDDILNWEMPTENAPEKPKAIKVQKVSLWIGFDPATTTPPEDWDFHELIDVGPGNWIVGLESEAVRDPTPEEQTAYNEQEK